MGRQYAYPAEHSLRELHEEITSDLTGWRIGKKRRKKRASEVFGSHGLELRSLLKGIARESGLPLSQVKVLYSCAF